MHRLILSLSVLLVAGLLGPAPVVAQDDDAELFASDSMRHVANLPYDLAYPDVESLPYGTDIEFATLTPGVTGRVARLAGADRVQTAAAVSAATFHRADTVLVATGTDFADALAAAPLAATLGAPVLLSDPARLPAATAEELTRLRAAQVILLGGEQALSAAVATDLADLGLQVERIAGPDRFATAAAIAQRAAERLAAAGRPVAEVLVAPGEGRDRGEGFQAALSASALGATHGLPLLLVASDRVPEATAAALTADVDVVAVGGPDQVGEELLAQLDDLAGTVTRIGGDDVDATAVAVAEESAARGADPTNAWVATTRSFPDALVSGAAVAATNGVLHLVDGTDVDGSPATRQALEAADLQRLRVVGRPAAVADGVLDVLAGLVPADTGPREYAVAGTEFNGMNLVDITDPEQASITSVYDCGVLQGDVQVFTQGQRTLATFTSENTSSLIHTSRCVQDAVAAGDVTFVDEVGGGPDGDQPDGVPDSDAPAYGTYVVDITDPTAPRYGGFIPVPEGSHNGTVHPSGEYFYNSDSALITDVTPQIQVYDIADLPDVERVGEVDQPVFPGLGTSSHDITFNADGTRMYSAALSQTVIYDTTDPANPVEVSSFVDPAINVEHQADPVDLVASDGTTRTFLIVEDELAGAAGNGFCPGGGMHIYDITGDNELDPMQHKVGTYYIPDVRPAGTGGAQGEGITCTAHVFRIYPEQQIMTIAWYNAGVWVLDLSQLADQATSPVSMPIQTLGHAYFADSDTWSFKTNRFEEDGSFYGYGNDIVRGLDVYRFDATATVAAEEMPQGRWVNQATAVAIAERVAIANGLVPGEVVAPRCLLRAGRA